MSYDTKYRPTRYADVMGQESHAIVLRKFVERGKGFQQSYLFAGQHGSGKTTLGRILARSLLCETPRDGEPCDECMSCRDILEKGHSECFTEFDAANNSTKDKIQKVIEDLEYSTLAGKQKVYLFDESHRLSKQAVDALLKPLEDDQAKSEDKRLVCIFCTTEPEKMPDTVWSRCAPTFSIKVVTPEVIAQRLAWVCDQEGLEYDIKALETIAAVKECHVRDALKAIETIALLGPITQETVREVLQLDANDALVRILAYIGYDLPAALREVDALTQIVSPTSMYERLSKIAMLAFKVCVGAAKPPAYWREGIIEKLGDHHGIHLVAFAHCFSSRPGRPSASMLSLDIARLHQARLGEPLTPPATSPPPSRAPSSVPTGAEVPRAGTSTPSSGSSDAAAGNVPPSVQVGPSTAVIPTTTYETSTGRFIDQRGVKKKRDPGARNRNSAGDPLDPDTFASALDCRVRELRADGDRRGSAGRPELGGAGAHPTG